MKPTHTPDLNLTPSQRSMFLLMVRMVLVFTTGKMPKIFHSHRLALNQELDQNLRLDRTQAQENQLKSQVLQQPDLLPNQRVSHKMDQL